jgi:hypothetical protein
MYYTDALFQNKVEIRTKSVHLSNYPISIFSSFYSPCLAFSAYEPCVRRNFPFTIVSYQDEASTQKTEGKASV